MRKIYFLLALLLFAVPLLYQPSYCYSPPDSCLKYYNRPEDSTFVNPDSVKIDSCLGSPTFGQSYGKFYFSLAFKYNVIPRNYLAPEDTVIISSINDILSIYPQAISEFNRLQSNFGNFYFRDGAPNGPDTTILDSRRLMLIFEHYVNIDAVEDTLWTFSCLKYGGGFMGWWGVTSNIGEKDIISSEININNPVLDVIEFSGEIPNDINNIIIYSLKGDLIIQKPFSRNINVSELSKGIYFIKIGNQIIKFIKL